MHGPLNVKFVRVTKCVTDHTGAALWVIYRERLHQWRKQQIRRIEKEAAKPVGACTVLCQKVMKNSWIVVVNIRRGNRLLIK
jgi:hypothetical protein